MKKRMVVGTFGLLILTQSSHFDTAAILGCGLLLLTVMR